MCGLLNKIKRYSDEEYVRLFYKEINMIAQGC